jgi:hypothetical protein
VLLAKYSKNNEIKKGRAFSMHRKEKCVENFGMRKIGKEAIMKIWVEVGGYYCYYY